MTMIQRSPQHQLQQLQSIGMEKRDLLDHKDLPRASVLVPLFIQNEILHVLLTQRPMRLKSHPGEVCFPGGRQDTEDGGDDVVTAFRETDEEVGLKKSSFKSLCRLSTVGSRNGLCVTPIVALWRPEKNDKTIWSSLKVSEDEVEAVFAVPLEFFLEESGNLAEKSEIPWSGGRFIMRKYYYQEDSDSSTQTFKIWGLTAHIIHEVATIAMKNNLGGVDALLSDEKSTKGKHEGNLWLWDETSKSWKQRYFLLTRGHVLHHYNNVQEANRDSATKKNRLLLKSALTITTVEDELKFAFDLSVLDGRITWRLGAPSTELRQLWIEALSNK